MSTNSFIEIYLTVFGWIVYDGLWDILTGSGLAYIPFIGALVRNFIEPYESQNERDASVTSIKRMEVDVFAMLTVVVLAGQPFLPVSIPQTTYTPICGASPRAGGSGATVSGGATGTTYDNAFSATSLGGQTALVPIWWMGVMRLSSGVTNAALLSIPCAVDLREVKFELDNQRVADPGTLRQIPLFITDCWAPSRALFDRRNDTLPAGTDPDDIYWAGSQTFQSAGYYDRRQAKREIPGFPFRATITGNTATGRDSAYYNPNLPPPQWGHPLCSEWWSDPQQGLRARILNGIDPAVLNEIVTAMTGQGMSTQDVEDWVVRDQIGGVETVTALDSELPVFDSLSEIPSRLGGAVGPKLEQFTLFPKIYMLK